ncbi:MAG: SusD/RagB family nutrient-binding outer membrane lipoprotein [Cyclobacteriaceae bacterium]
MKRLKIVALAFVMLFGAFSCDEALDINTDPLVATAADPNAVLPYVFVQYSARKVTELGTRICDVSQYISNTFNSPNRGATSIFLTGNTWGMMYVQVLGNLALVVADAEEAGATSNNIAAMAKVVQAVIYYELTSIWEEVPFTEAIDGQEFPSPTFDSQEVVLNGVVGLLDEAMTLIDTRETNGEFNVSVGDMIYGGDMAKWRILANSMKLRTLMMLRSGGAAVDAQINTALGQPLMTDNSDAAFLAYGTAPGAQNGMHTIITAFFGPDNESQDVFGPGDPIDALLNGSGDPRWDNWVARNDLEAPGNDVFPDPTTSVLSNNVIRPDAPDIWMTPDEIDLYKAELAIAGGFTGLSSAQSHYEDGVTNSLEWWGQDIPGVLGSISAAEVTAYVGSLGAVTLQRVQEEQYLAAFLHPVLAWNHVRRTGVPALSAPPASSISSILMRFNYPPNEVAANPNTPANLDTDVRMWFQP